MRTLSIRPTSSNEPKPTPPAAKVLSSASMMGFVMSSKNTRIVPAEALRSRRTLCHLALPQSMPFVVLRAMLVRGLSLTRKTLWAFLSALVAMWT